MSLKDAIERAVQENVDRAKRTQELSMEYHPSAGQMTNFLGMLAPGAGVADAAGEYPALPSYDQPVTEAFSNAPYPSMSENIANRNIFDASMQGLGVAGDALYATQLGAPVGFLTKGLGAMGTAMRAASKADKAGITALKPTKIDAESISSITDWVDSSKEPWTQKNLLRTVDDYDLKNVSKDYLQKSDLLDKDGNVTLYRYLNIPEGETLQIEEGIKSLTTDLEHAKQMAKERSSLPMQRLKEGETLTQAEKSGLSSSLDRALSGKYETYNLERPATVLEYKVPIEKIEGYLPALWKNLDEESLQGYKRYVAEDRYSNLIDDAIEQGLDYDEALEEVANSDAISDFIGDYVSTISDESEALVDLTGIKPNKIKGIESLDNTSRLKRAKEMGFRTDEPVYHGTHSKDIDAFDDKFIGDRDEGFFGRGHYFTSESGEASWYGPNVGEYYTRGKLLDLSPTKANSNRELQDTKYFKFWTKELEKLDMLDEPTKKGLKTINKIDDYVDKNVKVMVGKNSNGTTGFTASVKHPTRKPYVYEDSQGVTKSMDETLDSPIINRGDGVEFHETKEKAVKALKDKIIYEAQTFNELREVFPDLGNTLFSLSDYIRVGGKGADELSKQAKKAGYDGIKVGDETVIFDPKNIRRTDAEFDPKKTESPNLQSSLNLLSTGIGSLA